MKNFDWTTFTRKIAVKSTMAEMYNAWAKATEIEKWFLKSAVYTGANNKTVDKTKTFEKGDRYEWGWHVYEGLEKGTIMEANGKDFIQFSFAGNCLVQIKLVPADNNHIFIELTQKNIPTDDHSKQDIRLGCDSGWSFYLVNLKSVYEGGLDLRNKNPDYKKVVNG
jgi:hypothetical protein